MILKILADSRQVKDRVDADFGEFCGGTDPRAQEQLGRGQGTGGEDDFVCGYCADAAAEIDLEAGDRGPVEEEPTGVRRGEDREVLLAEAGLEVGAPGVEPFAVADVELDLSDAFDAAGIVVVIGGYAGLRGGREHVLL